MEGERGNPEDVETREKGKPGGTATPVQFTLLGELPGFGFPSGFSLALFSRPPG